MNIQNYAIYSTIANTLLIVIIVWANKPIFDKLRIFIGNRFGHGGMGKLYVMHDNKTISSYTAKIGNDIKVRDKTYGVANEDIGIDRAEGCPAAIVTDRTASSVSFEGGVFALNATIIDVLIQRAYNLGKMFAQKWLTYIIIALVIIGLALIIEGYSLYKIYTFLQKMEAAGRTIVLQ